MTSDTSTDRDREPAPPAHHEQIEEIGEGVRGDPRRGLRRPRRARRGLHPQRHRVPPPPGRALADRADGLPLLARLGARDHRPLGGEDPREHGDRPQRHARPVGLDERPDIHSSTWDWDTASPASAWKHSHNYVHHTYTNIAARTRTSATRSCGSTRSQKWHPVYLAAADLQHPAGCSSSGASPSTTSTSRRSEGREVEGAGHATSSRGSA